MTKAWIGLVVLAAICLGIHPATAQKRTDQLLWECEGRDPLPDVPIIGEAICASYLAGFLDMHALMADVGRASWLFCLPGGGISNDQARRVFQEWAEEHPLRSDAPMRAR